MSFSQYPDNVFVSLASNAAVDIYSIVTWLSKKTNYAQTTRIQIQNQKKTVFNFLTGSTVIDCMTCLIYGKTARH